MKKWTTLLVFVPGLLMAHSGHGIVESGPTHYLLSAEHLLGGVMIAAIVAVIAYNRFKKERHA